MAIKKKQGDSIWVDVTGDALGTVDSVWANWTGSWAIVSTIGGTPVLTGTMTKDTDTIGKFYIRIGTTEAGTLAVGNYFLIIQVDNATVDYRQEIVHEKITITAQGITP